MHAAMADELGYDPDLGPEKLGSVNADRRIDVDSIVDVPIGAVIAARAGRIDVAVARLASGKLVVVEDVCPHDGGRISSDGFVDGDVWCAPGTAGSSRPATVAASGVQAAGMSSELLTRAPRVS